MHAQPRPMELRISHLQIYNESVSDLLVVDRTNLTVRQDKTRGVFVDGLSEWVVRSPSEVARLVARGHAARAQCSTASNESSSRSHAILRVTVKQLVDDGAKRTMQRESKLNLVDLAGSERLSQTATSGARLEESKRINSSLAALGNVVAALAQRSTGRGRAHIPYRDSKLTRILEETCGGNCRTFLIAMVSPASQAFAESISTLKFASRAKLVDSIPEVNEVPLLIPGQLESHANVDVKSEASTLRFGAAESTPTDAPADQVSRYKGLLLQQRDLMVALTERLSDRDKALVALQEGAAATEHRVRVLEAELAARADGVSPRQVDDGELAHGAYRGAGVDDEEDLVTMSAADLLELRAVIMEGSARCEQLQTQLACALREIRLLEDEARVWNGP